MPADVAFVEQNDKVFRNLGGLVEIELEMQIIRLAGQADFREKFRYPPQVIVVDLLCRRARARISQVQGSGWCVIEEFFCRIVDERRKTFVDK